jgi:hypothetical protein
MDNLKMEMERRGLSVNDFAALLGSTEQTVREKLDQVEDFTYPEAQKIRKTYFPSLRMEYLFAVSDHRNTVPAMKRR